MYAMCLWYEWTVLQNCPKRLREIEKNNCSIGCQSVLSVTAIVITNKFASRLDNKLPNLELTLKYGKHFTIVFGCGAVCTCGTRIWSGKRVSENFPILFQCSKAPSYNETYILISLFSTVSCGRVWLPLAETRKDDTVLFDDRSHTFSWIWVPRCEQTENITFPYPLDTGKSWGKNEKRLLSAIHGIQLFICY